MLQNRLKIGTAISAVALCSIIGLTAISNTVSEKANASSIQEHRDDQKNKVILTFSTVGDSRADASQPGLTGQDINWLNCYGFDENFGKTKLIKSFDLAK